MPVAGKLVVPHVVDVVCGAMEPFARVEDVGVGVDDRSGPCVANGFFRCDGKQGGKIKEWDKKETRG